jgi:hypothetical protein
VRRLLLLALCGLALFAAPAQAKPLLGINGNLPRFTELTGQSSRVHQAFLTWGQGQSFGSSFVSLFATLTPIPMIHLGTAQKPPGTNEAISPAAIASGAGDVYLIALNQAISQWGKSIYVRPMAEMNNYISLYSGFDKGGGAKPGHSPSDYRKAFARIYVILHGGSVRSMNARLRPLGIPLLSRDLPVNPFPRLRIVWSPLVGGNPRIPANDAQNYYPGILFVDVEAGDIFEDELGDTAPWADLEELYSQALARKRPFAVPEWGMYDVDDDVFVQHMCRFLKTHGAVELAAFYDSQPGSIFDLQRKPKSLKAYRDCVVPQAAALPFWTTVRRGGGTTTGGGGGQPAGTLQPVVTFVVSGKPVAKSTSNAPSGANELDVNFDPHTGVIGNAVWVGNGKALGPVTTVPLRASGFVFTTNGASGPTPLVPPAGATGIHVVWDPTTGVIKQASWYRVGSPLAVIPIPAGQTAMGFQGGG